MVRQLSAMATSLISVGMPGNVVVLLDDGLRVGLARRRLRTARVSGSFGGWARRQEVQFCADAGELCGVVVTRRDSLCRMIEPEAVEGRGPCLP